jgi:hypothetical protein
MMDILLPKSAKSRGLLLECPKRLLAAEESSEALVDGCRAWWRLQDSTILKVEEAFLDYSSFRFDPELPGWAVGNAHCVGKLRVEGPNNGRLCLTDNVQVAEDGKPLVLLVNTGENIYWSGAFVGALAEWAKREAQEEVPGGLAIPDGQKVYEL